MARGIYLLTTLVWALGCVHTSPNAAGIDLSGAPADRSESAQRSVNEADLGKVLDQGSFALISAEPSAEDGAEMVASNCQRQDLLEHDLRALGYSFMPVNGSYHGMVERSLLVQGQPLQECDLFTLGRKYHQESVIIVKFGTNALVYTTGPRTGSAVIGHGWSRGAVDDQGDSSIELASGQWFRFVLHFDVTELVAYAPWKRCF